MPENVWGVILGFALYLTIPCLLNYGLQRLARRERPSKALETARGTRSTGKGA